MGVCSALSSILASVTAFGFLINGRFTSVENRIDGVKESNAAILTAYGKSIDSGLSSIERAAESVTRVENKIDQLDQDILFLREFTTQLREIDDRFQTGPYLYEARFQKLPVGGLGPEPMEGWPTWTIEVQPSLSDEQLEQQKGAVSVLLRRLVTTDRRFNYSDEDHEILVFENIYQAIDRRNPVLQLTAFVFPLEETELE